MRPGVTCFQECWLQKSLMMKKFLWCFKHASMVERLKYCMGVGKVCSLNHWWWYDFTATAGSSSLVVEQKITAKCYWHWGGIVLDKDPGQSSDYQGDIHWPAHGCSPANVGKHKLLCKRDDFNNSMPLTYRDPHVWQSVLLGARLDNLWCGLSQGGQHKVMRHSSRGPLGYQDHHWTPKDPRVQTDWFLEKTLSLAKGWY